MTGLGQIFGNLLGNAYHQCTCPACMQSRALSGYQDQLALQNHYQYHNQKAYNEYLDALTRESMKRIKSMKTLCLDFDGVIHSYDSGWKGAEIIPDSPVDGAMEFIYKSINNFEVNIYSSRSNQEGGIEAMQVWLLNALLERFGIKGLTVFKEIKWPTTKPAAFLTIDDRAIRFDGSFDFDQDELLNFKPWNKE